MSELSSYFCQRQAQGQLMKVRDNYWRTGWSGVLQEPLGSAHAPQHHGYLRLLLAALPPPGERPTLELAFWIKAVVG